MLIATPDPTTRIRNIAAKIVQPWRLFSAYRPNVAVRPNGMIRISSISSQFVIPFELSNGWAELALKKPPPLLPSSLIDSCEASGPRAIVCWAPSSVVIVCGSGPGLDDALRYEHDGGHEGDRQEDVDGGPGQVDPEVADRVGRPADEPADQRDGDGHAGRGRGEVLDGEAGGLGQVGHRRLAGVVLPVRVGHEADCGIEGQELLDRAKAGLVERQAPWTRWSRYRTTIDTKLKARTLTA